MSVSTSIPDTQLGLTPAEVQILRQQQQIALQGSHTGNGTRGRGSARNSAASSRGGSTQGRLLLDPMSLRALSHQLDHLEHQIRTRLDYLEEQMQLSIQGSYDRAGNVVRDAETQIARTRSILASIDEVENELAKILNIREIVKGFRARIEAYDRRLDQSSVASSHRRR
ncbi:hypothetical protein Egran_03914 [Elaphomyces granulatus]|uniref:Biogenesis of lysosome-related organelles complex 1 subunit CNL1 n=1 Tax=Elaphomyces granulatus TaxID=519963 RepID=A0A232LW75_9EURO|nr:hypothetical protein Egran_03914 [Elaphomyces granulatus]